MKVSDHVKLLAQIAILVAAVTAVVDWVVGDLTQSPTLCDGHMSYDPNASDGDPPHWEDLGHRPPVRRLEVPGGWLYQVQGRAGNTVFVPAPTSDCPPRPF